jgi:hypothetical protein
MNDRAPVDLSHEQLLSAFLLHVYDGVRSERLLMEQMGYNLSRCRFSRVCVGRCGVRHDDLYEESRAVVAQRNHVTVVGEHVSVDGTLIEACHGHKGFQSKDDEDGGGW